MERAPQVFKDGQDALVMAAQLHRVALTKLAKAAGKHIEGLHQGVAVLRGAGLSATTVRKLRELEVIYGFLRHVTEFSCRAFVEQLDGELERVGKERRAQRLGARVPSVLPQTPLRSDRSDGGSESLGSQASADARSGIASAERLSGRGSANGDGVGGRSAPQPVLTTTVTADECASVASGGAGVLSGECVGVPAFPFAQRDWYIGESMADAAVQTCGVDQCKGKNKKREGGERARCGAQQPPASASPTTPATPPSSGRDDGDSEPASSEARADARRGVASAERLSGKGGAAGGGASEGGASQRASPTTAVPALAGDGGDVFKRLCNSLHAVLCEERGQTCDAKAELVSKIEALASRRHAQIYEVCVKDGRDEEGKQSERRAIRFWHQQIAKVAEAGIADVKNESEQLTKRQAFFLFPACPKVDEAAVTMARVFGGLYTIIFILVAARGPLLWAFELLTGRETSIYLKICRQTDKEWKPCIPRAPAPDLGDSDKESLKAEEEEDRGIVDWLLSKCLGWAPRLLSLVREARAFFDARVMQAFRASVVICFSRLIFMLVDPWHVNEVFPALLVGPLYGVVYPSLNWCFVQGIWLLSLRTGVMPSKRPWLVKVPVLSNIIEYLVQVIADLIRGFNVAPAQNQWLMICQVYFLSFGFIISGMWFLVIPLVLKNIRNFPQQQQRRFRIELFLITMCSPFKMAHSTFSLLFLLPGNLCAGIPVWAQLLFKEVFVFLEFVTMLTHALVTVYHASL